MTRASRPRTDEAPAASAATPADPAIRERAEARLRERVARGSAGGADTERLLHELGVHQIELELQNEQLVQAQMSLEAASSRYEHLYEQAPFGYLTLDLSGKLLQANARATALFGFAPVLLMQRRMAELVVPESWPEYERQMRTLLRDNTPRSFEVQVRVAGSARRWVAVEMVLTVDEPEHTPQLRLALIDIDERVAMRRRLEQLASIVASSDDAIVGRDADGRVTSWNDAAARLFGWTEAQMRDRTLDALLPDERRDEDAELLRRLGRGETIEPLETERLAADGRRIPVSIRLSPILAGDVVVGSSLIARDVSDRRQAEKALQRRVRQLDLLSQAGQMLIIGDGRPGGGDREPALAELFDRVRLAIGCETFLHYVRDGDRLRLAASGALPASLHGRCDELALDDSLCGLVLRRGVPLIVEDLPASALPDALPLRQAGLHGFAGFPLRLRDQVHGVVAFASSAQRRLRDGDLQVVQTVCDQVSAMLERVALVDELREREARLQRADRAKDDFIATLAHELRNPLAPIRNAVDIMKRGTLDDPRLAWCRDIIARQVGQMSRLLDDLLDVSRVTRNRVELRRERLDLMDAVDRAVEAVQPLIDLQRHRLVVAPPAEAIVVYGDALRLSQVFANLLNNAAKYTDPGGRIELTVQRDDDHAVVSVADSGIGIDAPQLQTVFGMFSQLKPAIERSRGGLGIGLSLARGLVELHGGTIDAASAGPGCGSTFRVRLPIVLAPLADAADSAPAALDEVAATMAHRRVLVADDNADAARTLAAVLQLHGHEVRTAFGGQEAMTLADAWRPDVAVLDLGMPDLNGFELSRRIREQPWGEQMLLIACTGWGQADDRTRARASGFDLHVVKPIDPDTLLRLIDSPPR